MIEWVSGFVGGIVSSWIFLLGVFFFAIIAERSDRLGWSIFLGILTVVSFYATVGLSGLTGLSWWMLVIIYAAGGITHALWRWFRSTAIITEKYNTLAKNGSLEAHTLRSYKEETDYRENIDKISYWILAWPISGAAHFLGDVVVAVQKMVTKFFSGVFDAITERARSKASFKVSELDDL